MRSFVLSLLLSVVAIVGVSAQTVDAISKGVKLIDEAQYRLAINYFLQQPQSVESEYQLGKIYLIQAQNDSAEIHFSNAARINPTSPYAFISLAAIDLQKNNMVSFPQSMKKARKAAKKNDVLLAEIALVCVLGTQKDYSQAIDVIEYGKEVNSHSAPISIAKGDMEFSRKEYGTALSAYEWAVSYDKTNALAYRKMGVIQTMARDFRNGSTSLNKSIELNPDQILVYKNLSDLQFLFGKYEEALVNYQLYLDKATPSIDDKERYALILFFSKKNDAAAKELDIILAENPKSVVPLRIRGYIAYESGEYVKGADFLKRFLEIQNPSKILQSDYSYYAKSNFKLKNDSLAIVYYLKSIAMDSTKTDVYEDLGSIYSRLHQHVKAVACYNKMILNGFPRANGLLLAGKEFFFMGTYLKAAADTLSKLGVVPIQKAQSDSAFQAADSTFNELISVSPTYSGGYFWKARALTYLDPESTQGLAKPSYEKAAELFELGDATRVKKSLIECYQYLASFNYLAHERDLKTNPEASKISKASAILFFEKSFQLDPTDVRTKDILTQLKK